MNPPVYNDYSLQFVVTEIPKATLHLCCGIYRASKNIVSELRDIINYLHTNQEKKGSYKGVSYLTF